MDIKDLMLGDWVKPEHFRPGRVSYLSAERGCIECLTGPEEDEDDDYEGYHAFWPEGFEPIPLTEEILKANGFEVMHFSPRLYSNFDLYRQGILIEIGNTIMYPLPNGRQIYEGYKMVISVPYVHELQHALRLCGLNDIADNFKVE